MSTTPETKPGFLSAGITAFSPWGTRSPTPKSPLPAGGGDDRAAEPQRGGDHTVRHRHWLSLKKYPADCPPPAVRWFHAVDVPKRRPFAPPTGPPPPPDKAAPPAPRPRKWIPFSTGDSRAIEAAFQRQADQADGDGGGDAPQTVKVNEDYLFDVDIAARELAPAYWLGPVYEVKRGTWFTPDGEPCDEGFATQLEEGYLKTRPWRFAQPPPAAKDKDKDKEKRDAAERPATPRASAEDLRGEAATQRLPPADDAADPPAPPPAAPPDALARTYRLFGAHMNSVVTYQDGTTAWVLTDDFLSRMGSTLYQRFAGGAHYAGAKYVRSYLDPALKKPARPAKDKDAKAAADKDADRPGTPSMAYGEDPDRRPTTASSTAPSEEEDERPHSPSEARRETIERHMSSFILSAQSDKEDPAKEEEEMRKRDEKEMREDYKDQSKDEQGREIEHLLLVTHGIGQRLGIRMESVNFIHDVNTMRKSLKAVYAHSPDLQALNSEAETETKNSRIQALPICWRHLLDFPKQSLQHNRKEHDLGDLDFEDDEYPRLEDITVEGVPAVRSLLTDLALDILLYQSPAYKAFISRIVLQECNRIYALFKERNPGFHGKVSLVGHSLGSAIMFDLLCQQKKFKAASSSQSKSSKRRNTEEDLQLDFEVEDFYALGSPIGLFQMLKGRTIASRPSDASSFVPPETPSSPGEDPFSTAAQAKHEHAFDITTSSPACRQLYNIFHPTDPISYRLEPLISPAMSALKPQPLPYTKRGIFGAPVTQGLTGIGARVGQGVTDLWTSVSSGIASGILNRSLGLTGTDASKMSNDLTHGQRSSRPLSVGPGANPAVAQIPPLNPDEPARAFINEERKRRLGEGTIMAGSNGERPPTLIDTEIETLYSGFQKRRESQKSDEGAGAGPGSVGGVGGADERSAKQQLEWRELEDKSRRLRKEEAKVRALNANGRVDYSIQEGAFDISLLASIASHLSYWADEDVAHFMISQLLASHRVFETRSELEVLSAKAGET